VSLVHFTEFFQGENKLSVVKTVFCGGKMCYAATSHMRRVVFLVNSQTTYVHIHCKIQTGLENIYFFSLIHLHWGFSNLEVQRG